MTAGSKTGPASPTEWEAEGKAAIPIEWQPIPQELGEMEEAVRSMEWRKTLGGTASEWEGESSRRRESTPPESMHCPRGDETPGVATAGEGVLGGGGQGQGMDGTPRPPKKPRREEPAAVAAIGWAG